jgi:FixJ family two-component response regulator
MQPGKSKVETFDINQLIIDTVQLLNSEAVIKQVSVNMRLASDTLNVSADKIQIQQVLINLITNAIDAMEECEFTKKHLEICTRRLEKNMAEVSAEGPGGCFSFSLPIKLPTEKIKAPDLPEIEESSDKCMEQVSTEATIFIVDDDDSFRVAIARLVVSLGYVVEEFQSAQQFLQRDSYNGIGCLLVDLRMPGKSGIDLQAALNRHEYTMPVIFITGAGDTESGVQAMKNGALDFLAKPIDEHKLSMVIKHAIEVDRQGRSSFTQYIDATARISNLTNREVQVMNLVIKGQRNKQIAFTLGISEKTVKVHRGNLMRKASVDSVADLVRLSEIASKDIPH